MALDGFVISNIVYELNQTILNAKISKIAQPENDELLFTCKGSNGQFRLGINADIGLPRLIRRFLLKPVDRISALSWPTDGRKIIPSTNRAAAARIISTDAGETSFFHRAFAPDLPLRPPARFESLLGARIPAPPVPKAASGSDNPVRFARFPVGNRLPADEKRLRKLFLPAPLDAAYTAFRSIRFLWKGVRCVLSRRLEVEVLDALSIGVSLLRGDFGTAGSVMFLLNLGSLLEEWTRKKSLDDLARSMALNVDKVWVRSQGTEVLVPLTKVRSGDEVVVRSGNMIPLDGTVLEAKPW